MSHRGAGTRACRAGTHPGACTGPTISLGPNRNTGFDRIVLDVSPDANQLGVVADPVIVGLSLPKGIAGSVKKLVRLTSGHAFQRAQHSGDRDFGPKQNMDMVGHENPGTQIVVAEFSAAMQALNHDLGDLLVLQIHRPLPGSIQISIHPNESLTRSHLSRRRISRTRQASVQMPGDEQPFSFNVPMRQTASRYTHEPIVQTLRPLSHCTTMLRDESRRGRHECLRHEVIT